MKKLRVLIADDDRAFAESLRLYLEGQDDIECVGCTSDGEEALACMYRQQPDALVLDVGIPCLDGVDILQEVQLLPEEERPSVYVMTAYGEQNILRKELLARGARACLEKPYSCRLLCERIRAGGRADAQQYKKRVERTVNQVMLAFEVPAKGLGYRYMARALKFALLDEKPGWMVKDLMNCIADENNTSARNVEKEVRLLVTQVFGKNSKELQDLLQKSRAEGTKHLSNGEFIRRIADAIREKYDLYKND